MASVKIDMDTGTIAQALVDAGPTRVAEVMNQIGRLWDFDGKIKHASEATSGHLSKNGIKLLHAMYEESAQ